jgi:hypothetical protein
MNIKFYVILELHHRDSTEVRKKSRNIDKTKFIFPPVNIANSPNILTDSKRPLKELSSKYIFLKKKTNLNFT